MPSFKELIEKNGKQLEISFTHWYYRSRDEFWSERNTYTSENIRTVNFKFDGALFTSVMRCLDITLEGNYTSAIEKGDAICNFSITVSDSAAHSSTINYGTFYVAKTPEYDVDTDLTKLCCYDEMYRAMQPYDLSGITFPISLKNYLKAICVRLNWQHANTLNYSALVNGDKMITSDPYIGIAGETESAYTFRDVLDEIARCAGCSFAFKSNANGDTIDVLYIIYETNGSGSMKESMFTLDESNLKSLSIGEQYGAINTVIYSRQPQEDNVFKSTITNESASYNRKSVKLKQPEIADSISDSARLEWVTPLLTAIKGLQYRCYELESFGIGYMNFGDVFTIECYARNGNVVDYDTVKTYQTIYMRCDMTIDTNIRETTKLEMPVATATDYSAAKSATDKTLRQTYLKVNKQIGEIRGLITDPDNGLQAQLIATAAEIRGEISDDINGLNSIITATAAEINTRITNEKASLQTQISANAAGVSAAMSKAETVEGLIDGITEEISELAKNIEDFDVATAVHTEITKATTIQAIAGQVETNISGTYVTKASLPNELSGYAKQTDLPNMNNYIQTSVYNSKISQLDTDITSAVNRVTTIEQAGYITETTAQSLINQSSTAITATVTSNIKIGTVNLLYDSACFENALFNYLRASTNSGYPVISDETDVPSKVSYHFYYKCTSTDDNVGVTFSHNITKRLLACNPSEIIPNEKYTFSFYAKGGSSTSNRRISRENLLYFGNDVEVTYDTDLTDDILIFSTWKRYRVTFSVNKKPEMFQIKFLHSGTSNTVYNSYFSSLKLERGNVITDWEQNGQEFAKSAELALCVKTDENGIVQSEIKMTADRVSIDSTYFKLTKSGKITATSGTIGGWNITSSSLYIKDGNDDIITQLSNDGKIKSGSSTDNQVIIDSGHLDFFYNGVHSYRLGQTSDSGFSLEDKNNIPRFWVNPITSWGNSNISSASRTVINSSGGFVISANGGSNALILEGAGVHLCGTVTAYDGINSESYLINNKMAMQIYGSELAVGNTSYPLGLYSSTGVNCHNNLNVTGSITATTITASGSVQAANYMLSGSVAMQIYSSECAVGIQSYPLSLYGSKIKCKATLCNSAGTAYSLKTATVEGYTTATDTGEIIIPDNFMDYFENSEVTISPTQILTTASHSGGSILHEDEETGEITEEPIIIPEKSEKVDAGVDFTSAETTPDILLSEDGVDMYSMMCLMWKGIQNLHSRLITIEGETNND